MDSAKLAEIDDVVAGGIRAKKMPGCVVAVGRGGKLVFLKAYGHRELEPSRKRMTTDTLFDMASLTKPVVTATSVMMLVERGLLALDDPVAKHIPEFAQNGKAQITVLQLLTHQGGLIPDNSLKDYLDGPAKAWERIFRLKPFVEPGSKFAYSDVGFLVLAELVRRVSGDDEHEFSRENLFEPLGMNESGFLPGDNLRRRAATTQKREGRWMRGEVHDPRAYLLGGVAGHAGLFSTAEDMAVYAQMMLGQGRYRGVQILKVSSVAEMIAPQRVSSGFRGLGWDIRSGYSSNRGTAFSPRAFGHGGFTGTAMWIHPDLDMFVIFLSNRVHPDGKGSVNTIAGRIGTIAAASIRPHKTVSAKTVSPVLSGIDVLRRDGFKQLEGRRVGLITNHTGIDLSGTSTVRLLLDAKNISLVALFSPEHGIEGKLDEEGIADGKHKLSGLKIFSLYGKTRKPTPASLQGIDTLVFDIQDIGCRFYTYISTMGLAMQAAAERNIRFVVLDRPNPLGGTVVSGPMLDPERESFVGFHRLPLCHGMTVGELARLFMVELKLDLDLQIVAAEGWRRDEYFDATGLPWVNPSPNMRSLNEAILYPGIGLLETTNISVGRGTPVPFEVVGAPWLDGKRLVAALRGANLPGVDFMPVAFVPQSSKHVGKICGGVQFTITDRRAFSSIATGLEIARQLHIMFPKTWNTKDYDRLLCNKKVFDAVLAGKTIAEIRASYQLELKDFIKRRARVLLY